MQPVSLFDLAAQQARWLSVRQTAVANNVANANTPGYAAVEVEPFEAVLDGPSFAMRATHPQHVSFGDANGAAPIRQSGEQAALLPSGNTVVLETELMKAGEVRRAFELNTAIVKSFHRMLLMTTRS